MIDQFYLTSRWKLNRVDLGVMAMKAYTTFLKAPV